MPTCAPSATTTCAPFDPRHFGVRHRLALLSLQAPKHMDESGSPAPDRLSEEEAHRVLARAVELDARVEAGISLTQLREVASEAGITERSLEQALREVTAAADHTVGVRPRPLTGLSAQWLARHRLVAAAVTFVAAALLTPGDVVVQTLVLTLPLYGAYELILAVVRRRAHRPGPPPQDSPGNVRSSAADVAPRRADNATRSLRLTLA